MCDWWKSSALTKSLNNGGSNRVKVLPLKLASKSSQYNLIQFTSGISCEFEKAKEVSFDKLWKDEKTSTSKEKKDDRRHSTIRKDDDESFKLTYINLSDKKRKYKGVLEAGVNDNSSFYVLRMVEGKYMEAYPLNNWVSYSPTNNFKTLDYDQAQLEYENRNKHYSRWYLRAKLNSEEALSNATSADNDTASVDSKQRSETANAALAAKTTINKSNSKLLLTEADEWVDSDNDDNSEINNERSKEIDENDANSHLKIPKKPKSKANFKKALMSKELGTRTGRFRRPADKVNSESEFTEESDDGDRDADEFDYSDDSSSAQSDDSAVEDEKGVDQDLQSQAVPENNESEPDEDENVLSEEGKELVKLLNEFETLDQSQTVDDSDLSSSGSSSDFEEKMEQSLKSSKAFRLLNDSQQKQHSSVQSQSQQSQQNRKQSSKQIVKRNSTAGLNASKRKRIAKKNHSNKPSSRGS